MEHGFWVPSNNHPATTEEDHDVMCDQVHRETFVSGAAITSIPHAATSFPENDSSSTEDKGAHTEDKGAHTGGKGPCTDILHAIAQSAGATMASLPVLQAHNQKNEHRCVASAICTAMMLRAMYTARDDTRRKLLCGGNQPSVCHAYHMQRRMECLANQRCKCGIACGQLCDNCGSIMTVMVSACSRGICTEKEWPVAECRNLKIATAANTSSFLSGKMAYKLRGDTRGGRWIPVRQGGPAIIAAVIAALERGCPVVMNLLVYKNQSEFYVRSRNNKPSTGSSVYDAPFQLPSPPPTEAPLPMGHAVLIVGVNEAHTRLRVRNSGGAEWGHHGDMNMSTADLRPRQVLALFVVEGVDIIHA